MDTTAPPTEPSNGESEPTGTRRRAIGGASREGRWPWNGEAPTPGGSRPWERRRAAAGSGAYGPTVMSPIPISPEPQNTQPDVRPAKPIRAFVLPARADR